MSSRGSTTITAFNPPLWLRVDYGAATFAAANPLVDEGELALGAWNPTQQRWTVLGQGVFHQGFWLADPIAGDGITLVTDPSLTPAQPRFQLTGNASGGRAIAVVANTRAQVPLMWGRVASDPDHELVEFDGPCELVEDAQVVECVSTDAGLTLQVPLQAGGKVTSRVITLPMNTEESLRGANPSALFLVNSPYPTGPKLALVRRLMNFLVVDDANPSQVLTEFDPPMAFEIAYTEADADPSINPILSVKYWDEYAEAWVVLGFGFTTHCSAESQPDCVWGQPVEADAFDGPPVYGDGFFVTNPNGRGGVAMFTFDRWGDRLVAFGR